MTDMKRVTVSIPDDVDRAIVALRNRAEYSKMSYSEIIRMLVKRGLNKKASA